MRPLFLFINGLFCLLAAALGLWSLKAGGWAGLISFAALPAALAAAMCLRAGWAGPGGLDASSGRAKGALVLFSTLLILGGAYAVSFFGSYMPMLLLVPGIFNLLYVSGGFRKTLAPEPGAAKSTGMTKFVFCINLLLFAATLPSLVKLLYFVLTFAPENFTLLPEFRGMGAMEIVFFSGAPAQA